VRTALGDALAVEAAARAIVRQAPVLASFASGLQADVAAVRWTGKASEAASDRVLGLAATGERMANRLTKVEAILREYADFLRAQQRTADGALQDQRAAYRVLQRGLDLRACLDLMRSERRLAAVAAEVEAQATTTAALVRGAIDIDVFSFTGDPLPGASWHPRDVKQGNRLGDCYLLSTLMGFLRTDAGDALLRWDEQRQGYWVTLYEDGEPIEYFVDGAYIGGVSDPTSPMVGIGVAAIYEAAVGQHLGISDLADGGDSAAMMALITGEQGRSYPTRHTWQPWDDEYGAGLVRDALDSDASVTASSQPATKDATAARVEVQYYEDGDLVTGEVDIIRSHSYLVVGVADDGAVILRNPWGAGNVADGGRVFRVSEEDFREQFSRVVVSAPAGGS
jgi:hypothetical protein